MVGHKVMWLPECTAAPSPQKKPPLGSPVKIVFQRLLFDNNSHSVYIMTFHIIMLFRNSCQMPFHKLIPPFAFIGKGGGGSKNMQSTIYVFLWIILYILEYAVLSHSTSHAKRNSAKSFLLLPSQLSILGSEEFEMKKSHLDLGMNDFLAILLSLVAKYKFWLRTYRESSGMVAQKIGK